MARSLAVDAATGTGAARRCCLAGGPDGLQDTRDRGSSLDQRRHRVNRRTPPGSGRAGRRRELPRVSPEAGIC